MIDENYFSSIDNIEKAYMLSIIILNFKDSFDGKYLKSIFNISKIIVLNKYLNYNYYNKYEDYHKHNFPYFKNIDKIISILKNIGDVYISDASNFELCISSQKIINDIYKLINIENFNILIDEDLSHIIAMLYNIDKEYANQFVKAYLEQFSNINNNILSITFYNEANYIKFGELYNIPYIVNKESIGYTIQYKNSNMLDFLGKVYSKNYLFLNYDLYNFNNIDNMPSIKVYKSLENAVIPTKASYSDAGYDLTIIKLHKVLNSDTCLYDTGIKLDIPNGYYVEIVPRSSISKSGYMLANNIGIIDQSYRGNLYVALRKINKECIDLNLPWKCCQLIVKKQIYSNLIFVEEEIENTKRGEGGFGSTGN